MKKPFVRIILFLIIILTGASFKKENAQGENVEFVCMKKQMAAKQCHYNFKVDGGKYRYVDIGCHFTKKDEVIEKVKDGSLALAREWKIECPEVKADPKEKKEEKSF